MSRKLRIAIPVMAIIGLLPAYVRAYSLSGASAVPTMLVGDKFLVNTAAYDLRLPYTQFKLATIREPRRFDIVNAILPLDSGDHAGIKRIIGLPGETIELRENRVIVNGRELALQILPREQFDWVPAAYAAETYANEEGHWIMFTPGRGRDRSHAPVKLGSAQYFVMGDNRDDSVDSRWFGPISRERILGKMLLVYANGPRR